MVRLFLLIVLMGYMNSLYAQEEISDTIIVFNDNYIAGGAHFLPIDTLLGPRYPRRAMEARGTIEYVITGNMPDSLKTAIQESVDTWNKCLSGAYANFCFDYSNNLDSDVKTEIPFLSGTGDKTTYYTQSLHRQLFHADGYQTYDAIIRINASENWCIGISEQLNSMKNLNYAIKRSIALALGFGSSIIRNKNGNIVFAKNDGHSIADKMIFNGSGTYLSSIPNSRQKRNQDIIDFVTGNVNNVYIKQMDSLHVLYAPIVFDDNKSLRYLTNSNSIMYYGNSQVLSPDIDETTIDILRGIGWAFSIPNNMEIVGEGIDSTGVTGAYSNHRFYITPENDNLINREWEFRIALNNGLYQTIANASTQDFTIPPVQDISNYKHTIDGCLIGEILFTGSLYGEEIKLRYQLTLRLSPSIISVECVDIMQSQINPNNYDILIGVKYEGSYWLTASAREKGTSLAYTYHTNKPYFANMLLSNIRLWDDTYVTLSATNQYGTGMQVITIPAADEYEMLDIKNPKKSIGNNVNKLKISEVEFTYGSFDYSYNDFDDTKGRIRFFANNLSQLLVQQWMVGDYFPYTYWESNYKQINDSIVEVNIDNWFWGDKYLLLAYNDELKMSSDTIYVNDYLDITDPDICRALGLTTSISETSSSFFDVRIENGHLTVNTGKRMVTKMELYSAIGTLVARSQSCDGMTVFGLSHGIYILNITDDKNKKSSIKIRL